MSGHALKDVDGFVKRNDYFFVNPRNLVVKFNIRESYGDDEDQELKANINVNGVLESIKVQKIDNELIIRDGHRRYWACMQLIEEGVDIKPVPVVLVNKNMSDANAILMMLASATGKKVKPLEEASAFNRLVGLGFTQKEIGDKIGKSQAYVANRLKLVNASPEIREGLRDGEIKVSDAQTAIAESGGDADKQNKAIRKTVQRKNKFRIVYDKRSKDLKAKGNLEEEQEFVIKSIFDDRWLADLEDVGFDVETLKFSISYKESAKEGM